MGWGRGLFAHWRDLLEAPRLGEAAIVALPDRLHAEAAIALMEKGYHLLLEKPIAPTWEEEALYAHRLTFLAEATRRAGRVVEVEEGPRPWDRGRSGGEGGIRTREAGLSPPTRFPVVSLQPLGHLSKLECTKGGFPRQVSF